MIVPTDGEVYQTAEMLKQQIKQMKTYMLEHPKASVVEVILHDLLVPSQDSDALLLNLFDPTDFKNFFYWSKNTGLYFKEEYREALSKLGVTPKLRENPPVLIRRALKQMALIKDLSPALIQLEIKSYQWPAPLKPIMNFINEYLKCHGPANFELELFTFDEETMSVVLKENGLFILLMTPQKLSEIYFSQLDNVDLNRILKETPQLNTIIPFLTNKTRERFDEELQSKLAEEAQRKQEEEIEWHKQFTPTSLFQALSQFINSIQIFIESKFFTLATIPAESDNIKSDDNQTVTDKDSVMSIAKNENSLFNSKKNKTIDQVDSLDVSHFKSNSVTSQ